MDTKEKEVSLIPEEPLAIRVEGEPYAVIMRTPGEETFHAAGFCLAEGLVDGRADFASIGHCADMDPNVVEVFLTPERKAAVSDLLKRKGFVSHTSCGICGKQLADDLCVALPPLDDPFCLSPAMAREMAALLHEHQALYEKTHAAHAALLADAQGKALTWAEDVGRHNALDKSIGKALMAGKLERAKTCVLSSRQSFEMVQKAARAKIPVVVSLSRPTALAVDLATRLSMGLARVDRKGGVSVYCGKERFINAK